MPNRLESIGLPNRGDTTKGSVATGILMKCPVFIGVWKIGPIVLVTKIGRQVTRSGIVEKPEIFRRPTGGERELKVTR